MTVRMLQRRGTANQWSGVAGSIVLQPGEIGVNTTDNSFKVGDGSSTWNNLEYHYPDNMNEAKYLQLAGGNTVTGNQGITGSVSITGVTTITGNTSITGATTINGNVSVTGSISANNHRVTNVSSPNDPNDAANKQYVDDAIAGLAWKEAANLLATSNVALSGNTGTLVIDGHAALTQSHGNGYRIILTGQTTATENGIYTYSDNGTTYTMSRSADAETVEDLIGASIYVQDGTQYVTSSWVQTNYHPTTFDTIHWTQFSGAALITAGDGISKDGNELFINTTIDRTTIANDAIDISPNYVGQTSITTVSNTTGITTGIWNATKIAIEHGGTGATSAASALENFGLTATASELNTLDGIVAPSGLETRISGIESTLSTANQTLSGKATLNSANTFTGTQTVSGVVIANNYDIVVSAEASNTITLNFSSGTGIHTRSATGDITFTAASYRAGATKTIFITADSTDRTLTFPSSWIWVGSKPTGISASKTGVLTVTSLGTAEANAVASWVAQV